MRTITLFTFVLLFSAVSAQDYDRIANAFATGNAADVGRMCAAKVDYSAEGQEQNLAKTDMEVKLRSFFKINVPSGFKVVHKGVSQGDVRYIIAELNTATGKYRTTLYLKANGADYLIQSLELEKQ